MLTEEQIEKFHQTGFLLLDEYFPREDMARLLAIARADQELAAGAVDRLDAAGRKSRLALRLELSDTPYAAYARHGDIVEPMEQLLGEEIFHYHHKMMIKEPKTGGAWEWHQDYGYWYKGFLRPDMASCMIAVGRATRDNGCLQVLKGSHRLGRLDHGQTGQQTGAAMDRVEVALDHLDVVYVEMEPGTTLFFHSNLLHRSDPNDSDDTRWALICCYSVASNPTFQTAADAGCYQYLDRWNATEVSLAVRRFQTNLPVTQI